MVTIKQTKRTRAIYRLAGILVIATLFLAPLTLAVAETVKFRAVVFFVQLNEIEVGDMAGHCVGIFTQRGLSTYESGENAIMINQGTFDSMVGMRAYSIQIFEDHSTQELKLQGSCTPTEEENVFLFEGTFEYVKGSGRFEGIKGDGSFIGKKFALYDITYFDCIGSYTLRPQQFQSE